MRNKMPPFEITNRMIDYVAEIAELVGKLSAVSSLSTNLMLWCSNRIRHHPWPSGHQAEHPFSGAGDRCVQRQACAGSAQRHC